jgi:predicted HD phosphohydrolase
MAIDKPARGNSADSFVEDLFSWLSHEGQARYDEAVTLLEHALQSVALAECETSQNSDIVAALLHDVGHLLMKEHWQREDFLDKDLKHEIVGATGCSSFSRNQSLSRSACTYLLSVICVRLMRNTGPASLMDPKPAWSNKPAR